MLVTYPEAYSEPCQISKIKSFEKIINGSQPSTIFTKISILDVWQGSEYAFAKTSLRLSKHFVNRYKLVSGKLGSSFNWIGNGNELVKNGLEMNEPNEPWRSNLIYWPDTYWKVSTCMINPKPHVKLKHAIFFIQMTFLDLMTSISKIYLNQGLIQ